MSRSASAATARHQLVVGPLAGQEGPGPAERAAVAMGEGASVGVFAVAVGRVPMPGRALRCLNAKVRINRLEGVDDPRVVRAAEAKPDKTEGIHADDPRRRPTFIARRIGAERQPAILGSRDLVQLRRNDAEVVAIDSRARARSVSVT